MNNTYPPILGFKHEGEKRRAKKIQIQLSQTSVPWVEDLVYNPHHNNAIPAPRVL